MKNSPGSSPLISVVMCAYNGLPYIQEAVDSILRQSYTNWELIISDDGSKDGTREWLKGLEGNPRIRLFFQEQNLGYVANKNFAHRQALGEYITQQDNDDTCTPDRLALQMAAIQTDPELKIVACGYQRIDEAGNVLENVGPETDVLIRTKGKRDYPFWFPSLLVHHSVFDEIGYFDTYFAGLMGDDRYWALKANERYPILCLARPMYGYRNNPASITNVLTDVRKLLMPEVLDELQRQRQTRGSDWLEEGKTEEVRKYEESLKGNRKYMAEHYRIWAAKAIDKRNYPQAKYFMKQAIIHNPISLDVYRTLVYYFRKRAS